MVGCEQCGTKSPLDSKFCKHCGAPLSEDAREQGQAHVREMVEEGNLLFTEGRTEEALMVADAAVAADPSNPLGLSLKGLCLERLGRLGEALDAYEAASELNPTGTLDRIKVQAIRQRLAQAAIAAESPLPDRRRAIVAAAAAVVLVAGFGSIMALAFANHGDGKPTAAKAESGPADPSAGQVSGFPTPPGNLTAPTNSAAGNGAEGGNGGASQGSNPGSNSGTNSGAQASGGSHALPNLGGTSMLPDATGTGGSVTVPSGPITPITVEPDRRTSPGVDPSPTVMNEHPSAPSGGNTAPATSGTGAGSGAGNAAPAPEDPGVIEIQMSSPGGGRANQPGSQPIRGGLDSNGLEALRRSGLNEYQVGHYAEAATAFEKLAASGGNSALLQQHLGQCYENLGRTPKALQAYNRAVTLYQAQIKAGRNVATAQAGLAASLQHLKVLGGG
jgi:hypothetical protein